MATFTLHQGTETASGTSPALTVGSGILVGFFVNISAVSGVLPTLTTKLQQSPNGTDWYDVSGTTSSTLNAIGTFNLTTSSLSSIGQGLVDIVRLSWTVGGVNPSFTFTSHVVFTTD